MENKKVTVGVLWRPYKSERENRDGGISEGFEKISIRPKTFTNLHSAKIDPKNLHSGPKTFTLVNAAFGRVGRESCSLSRFA